MKKFTITAIILLLAVGAMLTACGSNDDETPQVTINMAVLPGVSSLGAIWLMENAGNDETENDYIVEIMGSPEEIPPHIVRGSMDIAAVPTNLASILYNQTDGGVRVLALSTLGVLHLVDTTGEIHSIEDLRGRTVHLSGMGAAPEFAFSYVLRQNGLEPGADVFLEFHAMQPQIAASLEQGVAEIALLPEPFATTVLMNNPDVRHALDLSVEWSRVQPDYALVMTAIIVRTEFLEEHPEAVAAFMRDFERSINFVNTNVAEAAELAVSFELIPNVNIAMQTIPRSNQVFIKGERMQRYMHGYLSVLYAQLPASVGGALPDDDFYFNR